MKTLSNINQVNVNNEQSEYVNTVNDYNEKVLINSSTGGVQSEDTAP